MGVLEELGLTEDDLSQSARPPLLVWDSIPEEEKRNEEKSSTPPSQVESKEDDFFRQLREGKFDPSPHPLHPEASKKAIVDEVPAKKKSKSKRVAYSVSCTMKLSGSEYQVQLLPESSEYDKAYRLNKLNAQKPTGYNVIQADGQIICECSDFRYRQDGADTKGCKHIRGLVDLGMFAAPSVSHRTGSGIFDA